MSWLCKIGIHKRVKAPMFKNYKGKGCYVVTHKCARCPKEWGFWGADAP